jgi:hypothetical protein
MAGINFDQITTPGAYDPKSAGSSVAPYTAALEKIISNTLVILTIIAGLTFIIYFLIGGLTWITSGGEKSKVESAKGYMTNGVIGLIVVIVSYGVVWIVGKALGLDILNPAKIINSIKVK